MAEIATGCIKAASSQTDMTTNLFVTDGGQPLDGCLSQHGVTSLSYTP